MSDIERMALLRAQAVAGQILTFVQSAVICRVNDMPVEHKYAGRDWYECEGFPGMDVHYDDEYRLKPGAPLTTQQAVVCLAMELVIQDKPRDHWHNTNGTLICYTDCKYRVIPLPPPEGRTE